MEMSTWAWGPDSLVVHLHPLLAVAWNLSEPWFRHLTNGTNRASTSSNSCKNENNTCKVLSVVNAPNACSCYNY